LRKNIIPLLIIGLLFGVFGFAAWLNSLLIPYFQISLQLSEVQTTLVTFAFFIAYVVMALPSSLLLKRIGFRNGLIAGLIIMAVGALLFIPAANGRAYWLFLTGLFVMGTGQALLQTAANPYITILGPIESAAQRNSFMGVCNKLAGIASQWLIGPILLLNADTVLERIASASATQKQVILTEMIERVIDPYWVMTAALVVITVVIALVKLPAVNEETDNPDVSGEAKKSIWLHRNLVLGVLALFCAEGLESITSYYIIPFGQSMGYTVAQSQPFVDYIIYAMLAGYLCGIFFIPKCISQSRTLAICAGIGILLCVGALAFGGAVAVACMIGMGFCNALNWPCIWPLAINGLGKFTKTAAALLIMAIAGDAVFPVLYAQLNQAFGFKAGLLLLLIFYVMILYYGIAGYKIKKQKLLSIV
jgi:MFS transporter, FHS family, L-fucose permease